MNWWVVALVLAAMALLRWRKAGMLAWAAVWFFGLYAVLAYGFTVQVPVSVINTEFIRRSGTRLGWFARWMLGGQTTKHWMRLYYGLKSIWQLKKSSLDESGENDYWQAGKSVAAIDSVDSCEVIMQRIITGEGRR